jgi:hypothetical protein
MGLFKRKVPIKDYCHKKFNFIFSENGTNFMDGLIEKASITLTEDSRDQYYNNFIAAYFELTQIAFSRNLSRDLRYEAMDIISEYLASKKATDIEPLMKGYNSAFGSSYEDGIGPMAALFVQNTWGERNSDIVKYFYGLFYGVIEAFMNDLKAIKIIH